MKTTKLALNSLLCKIKGDISIILQQYNFNNYDNEQLEYLVQLIDYILVDKVTLNVESINNIVDELITTSIFSQTPQILNLLNDFNELRRVCNEFHKISIP